MPRTSIDRLFLLSEHRRSAVDSVLSSPCPSCCLCTKSTRSSRSQGCDYELTISRVLSSALGKHNAQEKTLWGTTVGSFRCVGFFCLKKKKRLSSITGSQYPHFSALFFFVVGANVPECNASIRDSCAELQQRLTSMVWAETVLDGLNRDCPRWSEQRLSSTVWAECTDEGVVARLKD